MIIFLFFLLSLLMAIEASTSLSRMSGYAIKCPEGGLILQSSLALLSRMIMFMFMPFLGFLSDINQLESTYYSYILFYLLFPTALGGVYFFRNNIINLYINLINRISINGSFFSGKTSLFTNSIHKFRDDKDLKPLNSFFILAFVAYVPYYLSWPLIILLLNEFNEYRGMILGLSSVFNGVNTILLTLFIDPMLVKLGRYSSLLASIYSKLVLLRIYSSLLSLLLFLFFLFCIEY